MYLLNKEFKDYIDIFTSSLYLNEIEILDELIKEPLSSIVLLIKEYESKKPSKV